MKAQPLARLALPRRRLKLPPAQAPEVEATPVLPPSPGKQGKGSHGRIVMEIFRCIIWL